MGEVDDILDQNRAAQQDVDDEEEDEDDDEVDVTLLRSNIDKDADENDGNQDDEGREEDGDGDEEADDDEMEQEDEDGDDDEDEVEEEVEDDEMEVDEEDSGEEEDAEVGQNREKNSEGKVQEKGNSVQDSASSDEVINGDVSSKSDNKPESDGDEYADKKENSGQGSDAVDQKSEALEGVHNYYTQMLCSAKIASTYNIYPTAAIPIQTDVNAVAMSKGLKYLFLGGSDGYIRKYDFLNTMDGKLSLTILQKHSLAESIQNAGILVSYWENEIPQRRSEMKLSKNNKEYEPKVSPVYSIEVQSECLFMLSGLEDGGITMQGVRYMEGTIGHYFKGKEGHTNVVNQLKLNGAETRFISGSWDKRILEWDLQTGGITSEFKGSTSEVSSLEMRPLYSTVDVNQVVSDIKSNKDRGDDHNSDDDMGSLFGDDDEDNAGEDKIPEDRYEKLDTSSIEEISRDTLNVVYDESTFLTSGLNGSVYIWDRRIPTAPALSLKKGPKVPPWCQSACWCMDGDRVFAGRRNAIVEEFELRMPSHPSNTLKLPAISGPVTCVHAMPNNKQVLCASRDNIRLYNTGSSPNSKGTAVPFLIVPGHHGGAISNMYIDPTCRFLVSTSGSRGWQGNSTDTTFIYEIDLE
ncbi:hypothetical protein HG536_0B06580 [Torulaspora globosa]|uniref:Transcription factor spt8 beta-propeller domain-containing protein n=1 Tax=Torulaspora globosa TaxID=48254 RepID=A0A7G3ZE54_9SACH|nr:uncharacterized protein HG536_0B06580 [Torulaspora globosa]QLL31790.1 hypothetical protein HG536_0B06580 [Torulaspora globosa]